MIRQHNGVVQCPAALTVPYHKSIVCILCHLTIFFRIELKAPYTQSSTGTLPPGLELFASEQQVILYGTPTRAGNFSFTLTVSDSQGASTSKAFTITIASQTSVTPEPGQVSGNGGIPQNTDTPANTDSGNTQTNNVSDSGGGCDSGLGLLAFAALGISLTFMRKD